MTKSLSFLIVLLSSGIVIIIPLQIIAQTIPIHPAPSSSENSSNSIDFEKLATQITVKVIAGKTWGSGIIINREGSVYTVLTNRHVLTPSEHHQIQAPDGQIYRASQILDIPFHGNDLALLQFRALNTITYQVAQLGNSSSLNPGDRIFASGFPFNTENLSLNPHGLTLTSGRIALILDQPLREGYQLGYTNDIRKGMSGGPVFHCDGKVIGVNGMHAYPLWGDPYSYQDGSQPNLEEKRQMRHYSWAILMDTFTQYPAY